MGLSILGTKMGMTQLFLEDGISVPVTVIQIGPNTIVSHKTKAKDGYTAVQLGYGAIREKLVDKPSMGHFKKANVAPTRFLREFLVTEAELENLAIGSTIGLDAIKGAVSVDVASVSKGKGFAGVMKRHNFAGFPRTHGTHEYFRHGGSIGMRAQPGKVLKGKRMAGQMGNERVSVLNLRVVRLYEDQNLICVRGAVPGAKGAMVELKLSTHTPRSMMGVAGYVVEESSKNPMKASKASAGKSAPKKK